MLCRRRCKMDEIFLKNMSFFGHHGTDKEERRIGQRIYVDLIMKLDLSQASETDSLEKTVNYAGKNCGRGFL